MHDKGVMHLDWNPAFLSVGDFEQGGDGLTVTSFFNTAVGPDGEVQFLERDLVAWIPKLDRLKLEQFDPVTDVEVVSDLDADTDPTFVPRTVWPNEAVLAPRGVFPFEAIVVPQGFHPAGTQGRLTAIDLGDPDRTEYIIHQSTQNYAAGFTFPGDPANSPRFYHRALFADMDGDGLKDVVTVRSGFRVVPSVYPPFAELVYFRNPGQNIDPQTQWDEVILFGGFGPDINLEMHDFEDDGVPEIVATHFFNADPTAQNPTEGKISVYGAQPGQTWADVDFSLGMMPRVADISTDQGFAFDIQIVDLNNDGHADILASNHQPDGCTPATTGTVPGRVYALEAPSDIFADAWTTRVLLDDIHPNPTPEPVQAPGRLAPGRAQVFWPVRALEDWLKPWIVVGGDEASKVWVLRPSDLEDSGDWSYDSAVIFDINDFYGPQTSQTPLADRAGITISTIGAVTWRYDHPGPWGVAEFYIPVFEGRDIHVMSYRRGRGDDAIACPPDVQVACSP